MDWMKFVRAFWNATPSGLPYFMMKKLRRSLTLARPISSREVAFGMTSMTPHWKESRQERLEVG